MAITKMLDELEVLRTEHFLIRDSMEWIGQSKEHASEDLQYVCGIYETCEAMLRTLKDGVSHE